MRRKPFRGDVTGDSAVCEVGFDANRGGDKSDGTPDLASEGKLIGSVRVVGAARVAHLVYGIIGKGQEQVAP